MNPLVIVGYLWMSINAVVAFLVLVGPLWLFGKVRCLGWRDGALEWERNDDAYLPEWWAITLGWHIIYTRGSAEIAMARKHERRHIWQQWFLGQFYYPVYGLLYLFTAYDKHPLEIDAYSHQD